MSSYLRGAWRRLWPQRRPEHLAASAWPAALPSPSDLKRGFPDWHALLETDWAAWEAAVRAASDGPRVLLATSLGGFLPGVNVESLLAVALTLRGARVQFLLCDQLLPACQQAIQQVISPEQMLAGGPQAHICQKCWPTGRRVLGALGLPLHTYSQWVTPADRELAHRLGAETPRESIDSLQLDGLAVGEHAAAGALRYFARGTLGSEAHAEIVLRRYLTASILTVRATQALLRSQTFEVACFHHGIYVPQGLIAEVARQMGVRVVNWNPAYRKQSFIFSHHETYHHALMNEPTANWEERPWTPAMEDDILSYLKSRWSGARDWIWFHEAPHEDVSALAATLGFDLAKPTIGLLTNVVWDAQLHYPANAFPNMMEWIFASVSYFAARPELQLVIRIHPAEVRGTIPSRQPVAAELHQRFPELPPNVFVVPPDEPISTYALLERCQAALIYGTKMGVELASLGMPVIVAGEAWVRNKGITFDAHSTSEYFELLDRLPELPGLDEPTTRRARQYAYHFFMRRMIPLPMMVSHGTGAVFHIELTGLHSLQPGHYPGLDTICDGILNGDEFIFPAELYPQPEALAE